VVALVWGFAEATLFFFVPDVQLTRVALTRPRLALRCCGLALAGALAGGSLMYAWGNADPAAARAALDAVPAVSAQAVAEVGAELRGHGARSLFLGPLTGKPYKIYAVEAAAGGVGLLPFLAVSVPARGLRFLLAVGVVAGLVRLPGLRRLSVATRRALHLVFWVALYGVYFSLKGW
jgi:hypothetical protein